MIPSAVPEGPGISGKNVESPTTKPERTERVFMVAQAQLQSDFI
jgi:hypothetical protein